VALVAQAQLAVQVLQAVGAVAVAQEQVRLVEQVVTAVQMVLLEL
jgi:hypothetical protein